ncbi:SNF2-related protein [Sulfurimonas sp.]|uniref:SNF2-related protein n=1 Tax=Sulfurimonas sp. TaxID=2022749 RepID=UPI0025DA3EB5|nr:SNF2-related protein [Sulfurimonas sp.]
MPTIREILGVNSLNSLKKQGLSDNTIISIAKETRKNQLKMQNARKDALTLDSTWMRGGLGIAKGAIENVRGYTKLTEDIIKSKPTKYLQDLEKNNIALDNHSTLPSNFSNPLNTTPKLKTNYKYSKLTESLGGFLKRVETAERNYAIVNPNKTNVAGFAGEMAGGFVDPINIVPIGIASTAARLFSLSATGALSGGVAAYGGERDVIEGAALGAVFTPVIGESLRLVGKGASKLWAKTKDRKITEAQSSEEFEEINSNELFDNELMKVHGEDGKVVSDKHLDFQEFFQENLKNESLHVKEQVYKDLSEGKAKSVIKKDIYEDLKEFKRYDEALYSLQQREQSLPVVEKMFNQMREDIFTSIRESTLRHDGMKSTSRTKLQTDPTITTPELNAFVNASHPPSNSEIKITNMINDGTPVENRFAGWNALHALNISINNPIRTPEEFSITLKNAGFNSDVVEVFTKSYVNKDISLAQNYFSEKVGLKSSEELTIKGEEYEQNIARRDAENHRKEDESARENSSYGDDAQSRTSDEYSTDENFEKPSSNDDTRTNSDTKQGIGVDNKKDGLSPESKQMGEQQSTGSDGSDVPSDRRDSVVSGEDGRDIKSKGIEDVKDSKQKTKEEIKESISDKDNGSITDRPVDKKKEKNISLQEAAPVELSKPKRKEINSKVDEILKKEKISEDEKEILRQYTGKGGIESGTKGSLSEHYTPYETVRGIYSALDSSGFTYKKALEPAVGVGNFVGHKPKLDWTTVELDKTSHEITKKLYPDGVHYNNSFESFKEGDFDLVISNVPFIEKRGAGSLNNRADVKALHDYYFVSAVDKVKNDGVVAFVTSRGTMDKVNSKIRKEIVSKADVIGAYRLPSSTFSKNAHTEAITDVIFLQKRPNGVEPRADIKEANEAFVKSSKSEDDIYMNEYYKKNPQNILGDITPGVNKMYGGKAYEISGKADYSKMKLDYKKYAKDTSKKALHVNKDIPTNSKMFEKWAKDEDVEYYSKGKENFFVEDEKVFVLDKEVEFSDIEGSAKIYKDISQTKDGKKVQELIAIKKAGESQNSILGESLLKSYQDSYKTHPYKDKSLGKLFRNIDESERVYELGSYFDEKFNLAETFYKQTKFSDSGKMEITSKSDISSRMIFNEDIKGSVDFTLDNKHLNDGDFYNSLKKGYSITAKGKVQNDILYQSGDIYKKIDDLAALSDEYSSDGIVLEKIEAQRGLLEELLPKRKSVDEFTLRGDEEWLSKNGIELYPFSRDVKWIKQKVGGERKLVEITTKFGDEFNNFVNNRVLVSRKKEESSTAYNRRMRDAKDVVNSVLDGIKEDVKGDEALLNKVESIYNRTYNAYVSPDYKKATYLIQDVLDELPANRQLRSHQAQWVTQAIFEGKGINAHDVGGGKTLSGVVLARVMKKRGIAKKPLIVAPAKVLKNWEKEIKSIFPESKIINLFSLDKKSRDKQLYTLGNSEADFVLISHEGFKHLKLPSHVEQDYSSKLLRESMSADNLKGRAAALMQEKIDKYLQILKNNNANKKIDIDALGIDAIIADEARGFKNIGVNSKLVQNKLGKAFTLKSKDKGLVILDSASAYDFRFKTKYISSKNNGKNIFMLDATPTPNKPIEIYTMLKHLDDNIFDEYRIKSDIDFANKFFDFGAKMNKRGDYEPGLIAIKDAVALRSIMDRYVNRISMSEFKQKGYIDIPDEKMNSHYLDASDEVDEVFADIQTRLKEAKSDKEKRKGLMGVFSEAVSASVDPRVYQRGGITDFIYPTSENNKIEAVVKEVLGRRAKDKKAGQIVFLDNAGHEVTKFREIDEVTYSSTLEKNLHQELKERFVKGGYKANEIAIISGKEITNIKTHKEVSQTSGKRGIELKQEIVDAYTRGKIKLILGTTKSAGEGMNIQKFTTDIHHMDIPWTPAEIIQRNGRGVRDGNIYDEVNIHYYFQTGTFDELMYSVVSKKKSWNEALWDSEVKDRIEIVDEGGGAMPSETEMMLQMEKDPIVRRKLELKIEHQRLTDEHDVVMEEKMFLKRKIENSKRNVIALNQEIKSLEELKKSTAPNKYLKDLLEKITKTKDKIKHKAWSDEYDLKLEGSRKNIVKRIESKQRRILEETMGESKAKKSIEQSEKDSLSVKENLNAFEDKYLENDGIKIELEREAC